MPVVEQIIVYPIKSLSGVGMNRLMAREEGFAYDRRMMLVDDDCRFMSQRENARMALFQCQFGKDSLIVSYENDQLHIPLKKDYSSQLLRKVSVWSSNLKASIISKEVDAWFSDRLGKSVSLVRLSKDHKRYKRFYKKPFKTSVSFADGYPYLVLSKESMILLNEKLDKSLDINRFRANIIISGDEPHAEDSWSEYKIASAHFRNIKPCARCVVTTIDQETGEKSSEPLKTLSAYRRKGNKIYFGINAICLKEGEISLGQEIKEVY